MNDKKPSLAAEIATTVVTALLGFLLIINAQGAQQPLQAVDLAVGSLFVLAALVKTIKTEG